jgi:putative YhbY family RNA-binding protein
MPFLKGISMLQLSSLERRDLRARAHNLNPVVSIAENGLTEAVLKEIDLNLNAHELIKIRVYGDNRDDRLAYLEKICTELAAAPVQHIGKLLVVFRPAAAAATAVDGKKTQKSRRPASAPRQTKRSFQG